jgi:uncharacterized membrane protein YfcA
MSTTPGRETALVGRPALLMVLVGFVAGTLAGLLGIGGGALSTFGLVALAGFSQHRAHATSLAAIPPVALAASLVFGSEGNVDLGVAALLIVGSAVGALIGARVMASMSEQVLRRAFGVLMLLIALRLLL